MIYLCISTCADLKGHEGEYAHACFTLQRAEVMQLLKYLITFPHVCIIKMQHLISCELVYSEYQTRYYSLILIQR